MSDEELKALEVEEARLTAELNAVRDRLRVASMARCGVSIGEIVICGGKEYRVTHARPFLGAVWLRGNPRKKNGEFGTSERNLFDDWKRP